MSSRISYCFFLSTVALSMLVSAPSYADTEGHWTEGSASVDYTVNSSGIANPLVSVSNAAASGGSALGSKAEITLGTLDTFTGAAYGVAKAVWSRSSLILIGDPNISATADAVRSVIYTRVNSAPYTPWNFSVSARWKWNIEQGWVNFGNPVSERTGDIAFMYTETPNYGDMVYTLSGGLTVGAYGKNYFGYSYTTDATRAWRLVTDSTGGSGGGGGGLPGGGGDTGGGLVGGGL